jgi:hypothetical protein
MAKFAVISREALIGLLRRAKKGSMREPFTGSGYRDYGARALESYSKWKKDIPARTEAMNSYRAKTGSSLSKDKVLIPRGLLEELRNTRGEKLGEEMLHVTPKRRDRMLRTRQSGLSSLQAREV